MIEPVLMASKHNILFRIKAADIYLKAHGKCRKEGKSRDTAEDVVRGIMENKKIVNRDERSDLN